MSIPNIMQQQDTDLIVFRPRRAKCMPTEMTDDRRAQFYREIETAESSDWVVTLLRLLAGR